MEALSLALTVSSTKAFFLLNYIAMAVIIGPWDQVSLDQL